MRFLKYLLFPLQVIYSIIIYVRNFLYNKKLLSTHEFKPIIISVGNLKTGGTGKTPLIEYLINLFDSKKIAILSRGYGRKTRGFILANKKINSGTEIGDENSQLYHKFNNIHVACDNNRVNGVKKLLDKDIEIILLDDAYQHRAIHRDINILLSEYDRLFIHDSLLPIGALREHIQEKKRAHIIIVTKCPKKISIDKKISIKKKLCLNENQKLYFSHIKDYSFINMSTLKKHTLNLKEKHILVTGIENPQKLLIFLSENNIDFKHLNFKDHYNFQANDIERIIQLKKNNKYANELLLTEKDYYRLTKKDKLKLKKYFAMICIQMQIDFNPADKDNFNNQMLKFEISKTP